MKHFAGWVLLLMVAMASFGGCGADDGETGGFGGDGGTGGIGGDGGVGGTCPEENYPPSVVSQPGAEYPLNLIGRLNLDDPLPPGTPGEVPLEVIVRDPNVEQTLEFRLFLDSPPPPAAEFPIQEGRIEPSGFVERPRDLTVAYDMLSPGVCHKIELVVVGQFASNTEPRRPLEPGDFDQVTWWIEVVDVDNPVIVVACR
jgi:hypothetical protein